MASPPTRPKRRGWRLPVLVAAVLAPVAAATLVSVHTAQAATIDTNAFY